MVGGKGDDVPNGGSEADTFRFAVSGTGNDTINGFETALDRFDLAGGSFSKVSESGGNTTLPTPAAPSSSPASPASASPTGTC